MLDAVGVDLPVRSLALGDAALDQLCFGVAEGFERRVKELAVVHVMLIMVGEGIAMLAHDLS